MHDTTVEQKKLNLYHVYVEKFNFVQGDKEIYLVHNFFNCKIREL